MEIAKEVKKPVEAIQCANTFSLLQRKMYNVLLANAAGNLRPDYTHRIKIGVLCKLMDYNSRDYETIKERFRELRRMDIEWDIINEKGHKVWTNTSPLSLARVIDGEGLCEYEFTKSLIPYLDHPAQYAKFSLLVQSKFKSNYGLALFENCERYKNINQTCAYEISTFRKLMGLKEEEYQEFSDLKRRVINPATKEINIHADYTVLPVYEKKGRKTINVRFVLQPKRQVISDIAKLSETKTELFQLLKNIFNLTSKEIEKLFNNFEANYIREKVNYIINLKTFKNGDIRNLAGYLKDALNSDYQPSKSSREVIAYIKKQEDEKLYQEEKIKNELSNLKRNYSNYQTEFIVNKIENLDNINRIKFEALFYAYLKEKGDKLATLDFKKRGYQAKSIAYYLKQFISSQYAELTEDILTLEAFAKQNNSNLISYIKSVVG